MLEVLKDRYKSGRKIRVEDKELMPALDRVFATIKRINALGRDIQIDPVFNVSLNDVIVPNEFSFLVEPASISYDALNRQTRNVKVANHDIWGDVDISKAHDSYSFYIDDLVRLRGIYKKDITSEMTNIGAMRKFVNIADVINRVATSKGVHYYSETPFWPVGIDDSINGLFEDSYFNAEVKQVAIDYINSLRF